MRKKTTTILTLLLLTSVSIFSQVTGISTPNGPSFEMVFTPRDKVDNSKEFKKIAHKMYFIDNYLPCRIDGIDDTVALKYNIYKDEMEFLKNGQVLFLNKEIGRKVLFNTLNKQYEIFRFEGNLKYFISHNLGENRLLSREIVTYSEAKPASSSYQNDKPADFKRKKDVYYWKNSKDIIEIPSKKKKFYLIFGDKSTKVKKFVKSKKLNIKKIEDLKKIIKYVNNI